MKKTFICACALLAAFAAVAEEAGKAADITSKCEFKVSTGAKGKFLDASMNSCWSYGEPGAYIGVKLPKGADPLKITLEECISLIKEQAEATKAAAAPIAEFGDIKVLNGRYGPYIKQGVTNYKIPRGKDAAQLTEADCPAIIAAAGTTKKYTGKR